MRNIVVSRYILATEGPDRLWMEWGLFKEKTFKTAIQRLTAMQEVFQSRKILVALLKLQKLADNVKWVTQRYDDEFRKFRNEDRWTPELVQIAKNLATDSELKKRLKLDSYVDRDRIVEGVSDYFADITSADPEIDDIMELVTIIAEYAEEDGDREAAEEAVDELNAWDFTRTEEALKDAKRVCPELNIPLDGVWSYDAYEKWAQELDAAMNGDKEDLIPILDRWEDELPIWFGDYEVEGLDLSFLEGKRSTIYWYEVETERLYDLLQAAAKQRTN